VTDVPLSDLRTSEPDALAQHVLAAQDGDAEAFDRLVRATYAATYSLAYQLTGNADDANDVAQDTYLRAFRGLARFRGDAAFPTWLYRITVNSAHNLVAKRRRGNTVSLDDHRQNLHVVDPNPDSDPVARVVAADLKERVRHSLAGLPALARQVLVLREVEGLTHSAIADRLGITETAAKVRLHRARQKLKADLETGPSVTETGRRAAAAVPEPAAPEPAEFQPAGHAAGHAVGQPGIEPAVDPDTVAASESCSDAA
jgi:RNA polymerase sigma-70 factor, ECF subfamily